MMIIFEKNVIFIYHYLLVKGERVEKKDVNVLR